MAVALEGELDGAWRPLRRDGKFDPEFLVGLEREERGRIAGNVEIHKPRDDHFLAGIAGSHRNYLAEVPLLFILDIDRLQFSVLHLEAGAELNAR